MSLYTSGLVADECISPTTVDRLRERGIAVEYVRESRRGASDESIYASCAERQLPLLTRDSDFGQLAFREGLPYHIIIYLRSTKLGPDESLALLDELLAVHPVLSTGCFYIVKRRGDDSVGIRVRREPSPPTAAK